ncbi:hypothetical protein FGO68_gene17187 [Halteria grandinella]|uniref:Casein kinase I n=1 Tax=Halteria grandinella TaxID=5974 RepID=A0A8J8P0H6_HALGN|nr:hypothetical protein FGO68_gene17187 [Halteria grandinella]
MNPSIPSQQQQYNQFHPFPAQTPQQAGQTPFNGLPVPGMPRQNLISSQQTPYQAPALPIHNPQFMHSQQVILPTQQLNGSLNQFRPFNHTPAAAPMVAPVLSTPEGPNFYQEFIPQIISIARQNTQLSGEYIFHRMLGEGSYGVAVMYKGARPNQRPYTIAAKFDKPPTPGKPQPVSSMMKESYYLQSMQGKDPNLKHIMKYYGEQYFNNKSFVLIECLDYSIPEYLEKYPGKLNLIEIAKQMVDAIKEMHDLGFLHQDIKPDNFRIHEEKVKLLDFGLVNEYKPNGVHKDKGRYGFQGTPMFGSINSLDGFTLSRRDDLECIGYTIMFLQNEGRIPWKDFNNPREILSSKRNFLNKELNEETNIYEGIRKFITKANSLSFDEDPVYEDFKSVLGQLYIYDKSQFDKAAVSIVVDYLEIYVLKDINAIASDTIQSVQQFQIKLCSDAEIIIQIFLGKFVKEIALKELQIAQNAQDAFDIILTSLLQNYIKEIIQEEIDRAEQIRVQNAQEELSDQLVQKIIENILLQNIEQQVLAFTTNVREAYLMEQQDRKLVDNLDKEKISHQHQDQPTAEDSKDGQETYRYQGQTPANQSDLAQAALYFNDPLMRYIEKNKQEQQLADDFYIVDIQGNVERRNYYGIEDGIDEHWKDKFDDFFNRGGIVEKCFGHRIISQHTVNQDEKFSLSQKKYLYQEMKRMGKGNFVNPIIPDILLQQLQQNISTSGYTQAAQDIRFPSKNHDDDYKKIEKEISLFLEQFNSFEKYFGQIATSQFEKKIFSKSNNPSQTLMDYISIIQVAYQNRDYLRDDKLKVRKLLELFLKEPLFDPHYKSTMLKIVLDLKYLIDYAIKEQNSKVEEKYHFNKKEVRFILTKQDSFTTVLEREKKKFFLGLLKSETQIQEINVIDVWLIISVSGNKDEVPHELKEQKIGLENSAWILDIILDKNARYVIKFTARYKSNRDNVRVEKFHDLEIGIAAGQDKFWVDHNPQPIVDGMPFQVTIPAHKTNILTLSDD